ncbi:MAG: hypothetical protein KIT76_01120 [Pseudolabrys sp.]|jgi:hypothetical protein|nr:hypothetical protein [Pseudolabrys sp.]
MANKQGNSEATIFFADTRFERLARRPGGISREEALERAQTAVEEMKTDFTDWIDQQYSELSASLADIAKDPGDTDALERAQQKCAYLRDVGSTMGYTLVTFVATTLCDILEAYIAGATYDKNVIDCHMDAFLLARTDEYRHRRPEEVPELANGLLRVVEVASIVPPASPKD